MADDKYMRINMRAIGAAVQMIVCIGLAFLPFACGAALLTYSFRGSTPNFGALIGSFGFFLCSAGLVGTGFIRDKS